MKSLPDQRIQSLVQRLHDRLRTESLESRRHRSQPRQACVIPGTLVPLDPDGRPVVRRVRAVTAVDISRSGVRLLTRSPLHEGAVELELQVQHEEAVKLTCEVVRSRRLQSGYWELGLRFSDSSQEVPVPSA